MEIISCGILKVINMKVLVNAFLDGNLEFKFSQIRLKPE